MSIVNKLRKYFGNMEDVEIAYLFGSAAFGGVGPLSDVDIGVVFKNSLSKKKRFDAKINLINDLSSLTSSKVDVVELDEARLLLKYNIIKGITLKTSNIKPQVEYNITDTYLDRRYYDSMHTERFLSRTIERGLG